MKVKICAGVILAVTLLFVILSNVYSVTAVKSIEKELAQINIYESDAYKKLAVVYNEYTDQCGFLSLTVNRRELSEIEDCFTELCAYLRADMKKEADVAKDRLKSALGRLRQSLGVNI